MFMHLYMSKMSMFELCNYLSYSVYLYIIYVYRDHPSVVCATGVIKDPQDFAVFCNRRY